MPSVVFVCLGNICRSPTAEGVFRHLVEVEGLADKIQIDSSGTSNYHIGYAPDSRAQKQALKRGYDLSYLKARQATPEDFRKFDYICAMDQQNYNDLAVISPDGDIRNLHLFLDFAPDLKINQVPDPYYGGPNGFEDVLDMIEAASRGLLADMKRKYNL